MPFSNLWKSMLVLLLLGVACKYTPYLKYYTALPGKYPRFHKHDRLTGSINRYRSCYDVTFYALDITPDINEKKLAGTVDIRFTAQRDFDTLLLDLHPCFHIRKLEAAEGTARYYRKRDALFVVFAKTQQQGNVNTIRISYDGTPITLAGYCTVNWSKDKNNTPWINTLCEGVGARLLWPCKDLLYDEADSSSMRITVPQGLTAVCNGILRSKTDHDSSSTFYWYASNPINVYNLSFAIGDYKRIVIPYKNASGTHDLQAYVLSYREERAKKHLEQLPDQIAFLEKIYGEYPWYNDGYKLAETPGSTSMEHQTAIHYTVRYRNNRFGYDDLLLHETAHEWWGNSVTAADYGDLWLHEGFATYSELLYTEHKAGHESYEGNMQYILSNPGGKAIDNKVPIVKKYGVRYSPLVAKRDDDIYNKGCVTLHSLRWVMQDDSLFFRTLKTFYAAHRKSTVSTAQFIAHVNKMTGKDYNWFFKQYLFDHRVPELNYYITRSAGKQVLHYYWKNTAADFDKAPLRIKCGTAEKLIYPSAKEQEQIIESEEPLQFYPAQIYYTDKLLKS